MDDVEIIAHIRCNATGEIRRYETVTWLEENGSPCDYLWADGNFACDCNRELEFIRAIGKEPDDTECGSERFDVNLELKRTGEIFYSEFDMEK